jgi:hypothetical protein
MLGSRGHWSTKSRRYSTTMTALRGARVQYAKCRRARDGVPLGRLGPTRGRRPGRRGDRDLAVRRRRVPDQREVWLALPAAARARERRRVAREELTTTTMTSAA